MQHNTSAILYQLPVVGVQHRLASIVAEAKNVNEDQRLASTPLVTLYLGSGTRVSGTPLDISHGHDQLTILVEGTQSDVLDVSVNRIEALVVHNVQQHAKRLISNLVAPPTQTSLPGKFQVTKRATELSQSVSKAAGGKAITFNIIWTEVTGSKDDKGTDANPQAMFWLVEAMVKAEEALKELLQLADFKADCLPSIQEVTFGGNPSAFSATKSNKGILFKVAYDKGQKGFFPSTKATGQAIMEAF